jgi:hypothetical protein
VNKDTFKHGKFYKITRYGRINLDFCGKSAYNRILSLSNGKKPLILKGKGEPVWFVGLAWKRYVPEIIELAPLGILENTPFYLIASNYYCDTRFLYVEHNEKNEPKIYRVKTIEPFTLKEFPLLIGTKTTTLFDRFLKGDITIFSTNK